MTKGEIKTQVLIRGGWNTTYTITETNLDLLVDRGHRFAAGYKKWPFTEGRVSTTYTSLVTNEDGYLVGEYPEGWKSDSIRLLKIGGKEVGKREFYKFTKFLEDNSSSSDRIFSDYTRRYYINPNIDVSGTVTAWGQYTPTVLSESDNTVFAGEDEGDEAIIQIVMGYIYSRLGDENNTEKQEQVSRRTLNELWVRIQAEQYGYQIPPDDGMFKRIDVLKGGLTENEIKRDQF